MSVKRSENESVSHSHVKLFGTPWTVASEAPLSMEFWNSWNTGVANPRIEPGSFTLQADSLPSEPAEKPQEYWSG